MRNKIDPFDIFDIKLNKALNFDDSVSASEIDDTTQHNNQSTQGTVDTFPVQFPMQLQVSLQPIDAFLKEFNIESGEADTLFEKQRLDSVEEAIAAEGGPKSPFSSVAPVPLMGIVTRTIDRDLNESSTYRTPGPLPTKRNSIDTPQKKTVQVPDLPGQFNGMPIKDRENAWNKFDYVMWATYKDILLFQIIIF